jgi:glycosyltransferase involved in cell wall biosynthesis
MRILIYGVNYVPELTGIGKYSGEMAEWLAEQACADKFDELLRSGEQVKAMKLTSVDRYLSMFTWDAILSQYEILLKKII